MTHNYCAYDLIFGKLNSLIANLCIAPLYNLDDYANESKYRLEIAYYSNRTRLGTKTITIERKLTLILRWEKIAF